VPVLLTDDAVFLVSWDWAATRKFSLKVLADHRLLNLRYRAENLHPGLNAVLGGG